MKRALLIGINYQGSSLQLNGCINDVNNMKDLLLKNEYSEENIIVLTDDTPVKPTRLNMINAILSLILFDAQQLFFHYSGHGSWMKDLSGDEADGRDETIVPLDYLQAGMISDDQLRGLLTFMNPNCKMSVVLDCCHSGTGLDLAYNLKSKTSARRVRQGRGWKTVRTSVPIMVKDPHYQDTPGQVVLLSGCQDRQTSADAFEEDNYQGAMTFCVLKALEDKPACNWEEFITCVRGLLKTRKYAQIANLTSGRQLNLESKIEFC